MISTNLIGQKIRVAAVGDGPEISGTVRGLFLVGPDLRYVVEYHGGDGSRRLTVVSHGQSHPNITLH